MKTILGIVALVLSAATTGASTTDEIINIQDLSPVNKSLVEHHTDFFDIENGFAVRRGQDFKIALTVENLNQDVKVQDDLKIVMINDRETEYMNPEFLVKNVVKLNTTTIVADISLDVQSAIGKYENIMVQIVDKSTNEMKSKPFSYNGTIYVLFNPWEKGDKLVYQPKEEILKEHVLNEYGNVFQGSARSYDTTKWFYGQSNQIILDAAFHLLEKLERSRASDVIDVIQTIARNQGMMRKQDGSVLVGSEDSLLEGNWGDFEFHDDDAPEIWTATPDILKRWQQTQKPTKYGQCWVFAALELSLMRGLGVPARQITMFGAWLDNTNLHDPNHQLHHVADEFYDANGTLIWAESQAWNFHSHTDVLLNREKASYSGWQSLDGTPPGKIGPAPVKAIHNLDESYPFNVSDVISTVHSTSRTFLVSCEKNHTKKQKLNGCKVNKLLKYDTSGLPLIVTSKTLKNNTLGEHNITAQFIDPKTDAFIPYEKKSNLRRRVLKDSKKPKTDKIVDNLDIVPKTYGITVGEPIEGEIHIDTKGLKKGEMLELNLMFTLETRKSHEIKQIMAVNQRVLIQGSKIIVPYFVDSSNYLQKDLMEVFVKIVATAKTSKNKYMFQKETMDLDSPDIVMEAPEKVNVGEENGFRATANFTNPLPFKLDNVCITLHSHNLEFKGNEFNDTRVTHCQDLKPKETILVSNIIESPSKAGTYYLVSSLQGPYLPTTQSESTIEAVEVEQPKKVVDVQLEPRDEIDFFKLDSLEVIV